MHYLKYGSSFLILVLLLTLPITALAIPAISCHCFTDRSYDPARPALADPYFLATTQNSFFSAVFATDKKGIVMKKQKGTSSDDLWIAYWVAGRGGVGNADTILQAKQGKETWQEVFSSLGLSGKKFGTRFAASLKTKTSTAQLAEAVVDDLLIQYKLLNEAELTKLRKAGGMNQEVILTALIAVKTRQPAFQIYSTVKKDSKSWGTLLTRAKIEPAGIQNEFISLLNHSK